MQVELPQPTLGPVTLDPSKSVLVIVDMENQFLKPGGGAYLGEPASTDVIAKVVELREKARSAGVPVIYVLSVRKRDSQESHLGNRQSTMIEGTWYATYVDELTPEAGATVVKKYTHDAFHKTEMDATLERMGIRPFEHTIVVCGVATGTCVYQAVLGFHNRHFTSIVPVDATAGGDPGEIPWALYRWGHPAYNYNITPTTVEQLTFAPVEAAVGTR